MAVQTVSAEDIDGTEVINSKGEHIGRIEDVMVDMRTGTVAYLVLSYGGIFGTSVHDKRFAVPFNAFSITEQDEHIKYLLDVEQEFLEHAPGFDKDNYPDFADPEFVSHIHGYYADTSRKGVSGK